MFGTSFVLGDNGNNDVVKVTDVWLSCFASSFPQCYWGICVSTAACILYWIYELIPFAKTLLSIPTFYVRQEISAGFRSQYQGLLHSNR